MAIRKPHPRTMLAIFLGLLPIIVVAVVLGVTLKANQMRINSGLSQNNFSSFSSSTPTPTVQSVTSATPTLIPTSTSTPPAPTVSPISTSLPDSAKAFLANFYAAYKNKDLARLAASFTADTNTTDQSMYSRLFTGKDLNGMPGGPNLFSTNSAAQYVTSYSIMQSNPSGKDWQIMVNEQRSDVAGGGNTKDVTVVTLTPAPTGQGTWLIASYSHANNSGKYDGFLLE
jgi:hypothetical protein